MYLKAAGQTFSTGKVEDILGTDQQAVNRAIQGIMLLTDKGNVCHCMAFSWCLQR